MINDLRKCRTISQVISTWLAYIELAISNLVLCSSSWMKN